MHGTEHGGHTFEETTVSVVIPFCGKYTPDEMLSEAVESAENQVGVETEILVVEDEDERGPAWARNVGLDRAETRYVALLDADDIWEETKLRDQLTEMAETGAGICVDGDTERSPVEFAGALLTADTHSLTSSILLDTEQVSTRFDESLERREDHLFMIEAAREAGICYCEETFYGRTHDDGFSNFVESSRDQIDEFFEQVVAVAPEVKRYERDYYRTSYTYLGRMRHFDGEYRRAIRHFMESLRYGPRVINVGALGITLLTMAYEIPARSIRRLTAGGAYE